MNEAQWLASADPAGMLREPLDVPGDQILARRIGDRKLRLFACACFRNNSRSHSMASVRHAQASFADECEAWADGGPPPDREGWPKNHYLLGRNRAAEAARLIVGLDPQAEAALLREVVGNPFRPREKIRGYVDSECKVCSATPDKEGYVRHGKGCYMLDEDGGGEELADEIVTPWLGPTARVIAAEAYDSRDFWALGLLADNLEDAGCTDADLLAHLRSPGPHVRGCWALDLVLGKQ